MFARKKHDLLDACLLHYICHIGIRLNLSTSQVTLTLPMLMYVHASMTNSKLGALWESIILHACNMHVACTENIPCYVKHAYCMHVYINETCT